MLQSCQNLVYSLLGVFIALEDSICDDQIVFRAKSQKFTVSVSIPNSMQANHTRPFVHLLSNPGIEVTGIISLSVLEIELLSALLLSGCCRIPPWSLRGWPVLEHTHTAMVANIPLQRKSHGDYHVTDRCRVSLQLLSNGVPYWKTISRFISLFLSPATPKRSCSHDLLCRHMIAVESHLALLYHLCNSQILLLPMLSDIQALFSQFYLATFWHSILWVSERSRVLVAHFSQVTGMGSSQHERC